jgi:predicted  nucleic acid-binding Zn-ribbon protein
LVDYQNNLDATEKKLKDASGFKLLRTAAEKKEQMDLLQKNIDSFKNEINQLKNESDQLKLELEKIQ